MSDEIQYISIRIADLPPIRLSIPRSQVSLAKRVEESINGLWSKWKERDDFRDKSSAEILAMVTFRFAQLYYSNVEAAAHLEETLKEMEQSFDALLLDDIVSDQNNS